MTDIVKRPKCWDFAMDFLGEPESIEVDVYASALEAEIKRLRAELAAEKAETFRLQCSHSALYNECTALRAELAALRAASASVQADQRAAIDQARELLRIVTAERDALRADALRYRWLRGCNNLTLRSDNTGWTRPDGTRYRQTHYLAEGRTQHAPADSLDATIDAAMAAQKDAP